MPRTWTAFVVALLLSACPAWAADGNGKVKVFILAGQSNMEGLEVAAELKGTLEGKTPKEQTDAQNKALDKAVRATPEYKAWQAEWDAIFSHWPCHYYGNGRNYCLIGHGLGEAMKELLKP